jgi:long-chain fatty acid transport protein
MAVQQRWGRVALTAYGHAFKKTVNGDNSIPAAFGGGNANVHLSEDVVGILFGKQF